MIDIRGLRKCYPHFELNISELSIKEGEIVGIFGPNGAGKSTFFRILMGMIARDTGDIELNGIPLPKKPYAHRRLIGYVPDVPIFHERLTVAETIAFIKPFFFTWDSGLCDKLTEKFRLRPDAPVIELSHGMRAKLLLVLALSYRPDILILDEPTSGMDPVSGQEFCELLIQLREQRLFRSALISSHQIEEIGALSNRVLFVNKGRIVMDYKCAHPGMELQLVRYPANMKDEMSRLPELLAQWMDDSGRLSAVFVLSSDRVVAQIERAVDGRGEVLHTSLKELYLEMFNAALRMS